MLFVFANALSRLIVTVSPFLQIKDKKSAIKDVRKEIKELKSDHKGRRDDKGPK